MRKTDSIFKAVIEQVQSGAFHVEHRAETNYFCRNRKINFATVVIALINRLNKSLSVEISKFLHNFCDGTFATKQAFSKARYKLRPEAFIELNDTFVKAYYASGTHRLYAERYLLLGVDGSCYELPWFDDIVEEFGFTDNPMMAHPRAMAKGVKIWDLLNEVSVATRMDKFRESETSIFDRLWPIATEMLRGCQPANLLFVGDAYYPGLGRMLEMLEGGVDFVMRCDTRFCREVVDFLASGRSQSILRIDLLSDHRRRWRLRTRGILAPPAHIEVRAVRLEMRDGTVGCALSSVTTDELDEEQVRDVYSLRYGEEVSFYIEKFRAQCENLATKMATGVYQEWYANILCLNMTQALVEEAQRELDAEQEKRPKKHRYKINRSAAVGMVKDEIPKLLFGKEDIEQFNERMIAIIYKFREPVRRDRSFPRKAKHWLKYNMNQRPVI